ncbi:unnamed protein product [Adineta steineri]|uniref:Uncharacterized protein n=1 Tax=Adineta steineri TaxID=433720 RepID=A0A815GUV1_9BILA|nr:unnamed protein product [Adineta steineri]
MDFMGIASYFWKTTPILPKYIINRNGIDELTLGIDCSWTVTYLRTLLTERLSDLSENEQFIHSNGAPIHILDEQDTIVNELLLENSNIISLRSKLSRELLPATNSTTLVQNRTTDMSSHLQLSERQYQQTMSSTASPIISPSNITITIKDNSKTKSISLSHLLSNVTLEIDNSKLSPTDMKLIVSTLKQNKTVKELKIISGCGHVIEMLVEVLKANTKLTSLDISLGMNNAECILIADALMMNHTVQKLSLSQNGITSVGCKTIGQMLKSNKTLTYLNICRNKLYDDGIKFICDALMTNQTLRQLDICQTNMSSMMNHTVQKLSLSQNGITSVGCKTIGQMLKSNKTLTYLNICRNKLYDDGIKFICDALMTNQTLRQLDICQTNMSSSGVQLVGQMLRVNQTLTLIDISDNNIGDNDITVIANALKFNSTLTELDVKWNQITEKGALALIDTLTTNRTLTNVKLQFNKMPNDVQVLVNRKAPQLKTTGLGLCLIL